LALGQVFGPRHGGGAVVQRLLVRAVEAGQRPQHATGQARPQHSALRVGQAALGIGAGGGGGGAAGTERDQLVGEQVLQALGAGNEELHWTSVCWRPRCSADRMGNRRRWRYSDSSSSAKARAVASTCAERRWLSSSSSSRAERARAHSTTPIAG